MQGYFLLRIAGTSLGLGWDLGLDPTAAHLYMLQRSPSNICKHLHLLLPSLLSQWRDDGRRPIPSRSTLALVGLVDMVGIMVGWRAADGAPLSLQRHQATSFTT